MISREIKSIVAQNCPGYDARSEMMLMSLGSLAESCDKCSNFLKGNCIKGLLDEISEIIRIN